jgi:chemotaxis regulatin CheY-phosphate phosphatase CheZ
LTDNWRGAVSQRLEELDWKRIVADVRPFLESPSDVSLLSRENLDLLLKRDP